MEKRTNKRHPAKAPNSSIGDWVLLLVFLFILPPLGVIMIAAKLLRSSSNAKKAVQSHQKQAEQQPTGSRTTGHFPPAPSGQDHLNGLASKGKKLTALGTIFAALFGFAFLDGAAESLYLLPDVASFLGQTLSMLCLTLGGVGVLLAGLRLNKKLRRYRRYMALIGTNRTISVSALARATGFSVQKVRGDLQDMLDDGLFPTGFLDFGGDMLVLSGEGLQQAPKAAPSVQTTSPADTENALLSEIRAVNDSIANEKLSAQIDRIGIITSKILEHQKSYPEKSPQLHSFLSYYLPTTLKILRAYAQLESQGIEGENISAAKARIETMMDKVVEGFENLLDQLFQSNALDVTSDVQVLEQMLAKDGLSTDGLRLN